jgi:transcription elongation factor Elf1
VASAPLLIFTCPKTKERASVDIGTDAQNLRASWKSRFQVKCPYCGQDHEISVRDAYLDDAIDVPGRPARPRNPREKPSG